jgi:hypothetical protein
VRTCLRLAAPPAAGQEPEILDWSLVEDNHQYGLWPDGTFHVTGEAPPAPGQENPS